MLNTYLLYQKGFRIIVIDGKKKPCQLQNVDFLYTEKPDDDWLGFIFPVLL